MSAAYRVSEADKGFYIIEEPTVRCFLLVGREKALLIDCGCALTDVRGIVEQLTDLPVQLAVTHADGDHIACCRQFPEVWMSPNEYANYHSATGRNDVLRPLWDGDVISLGQRDVKVVYNPGHTSGSLTFLDLKNRSLIGGDSIQNGRIFLFGPGRDLLAYLHTMERIEAMLSLFDLVYPSHAKCPVGASMVRELAAGVRRMLEGRTPWEPDTFMGTSIRTFHIGPADILYEKEKGFFEP